MHVVTSCGTNPDQTMFHFTIKLLLDGNLAEQPSALGSGLEDLKAPHPYCSMPVFMKLRAWQGFTSPSQPLSQPVRGRRQPQLCLVEVRWSSDCCVNHFQSSILLHYMQGKILFMEKGLMGMFAAVLLNTAQDFKRCLRTFRMSSIRRVLEWKRKILFQCFQKWIWITVAWAQLLIFREFTTWVFL